MPSQPLRARWQWRGLGLVLALGVATPVLAAGAPPRIVASRSVSGGQRLTADEQAAVRTAAATLLRHAAEAKTLLGAKNTPAASAQLDKAQALLRIIDNALPVETVKTTVRSGTLSYEDTFERTPHYVPIYSVAEDVSVMRDVQEAASNSGQPATGPVFTAEELISSNVQLDLRAVRAGLAQAHAAIAAGDLESAQRALAAVRGDLRTSIVAAELPAALARANLMLAQRELQQGRPAQARLALEAAGKAAAQIDSSPGPNHPSELQRISDEMTKLSRAPEQDFSGAAKRIVEWLAVLQHA